MKNFNSVPVSVKEAISECLAKNRIPHCALITGGSEDERVASALYFAAAVECEASAAPCGVCRACGKILKEIHPDVTVINTGGKSDTVRLEDLKQIRETCFVLPNEGRAKVYIIPNGGKIRTEGQNSLLKIIEEPPANVYIVICSEVRSSLLPTILSRAYEFTVGYTKEKAPSAKTTEKIYSVCADICTSLSKNDEFSLSAALTPLEKDRNAADLCAKQLTLIVRDALTGGESLSGQPEQAAILKKTLTSEQLIKTAETAKEISDAAGRNANMNLLLSLFASKLAVVTEKK